MAIEDADGWRLIIAAITALGGLIGIVVGIRTFFWRRLQLNRFAKEETFQSDTHVLKLCQALSDPSQRLQLAAAALLIERIQSKLRGNRADFERTAVIQALLAATIGDSRDGAAGGASPELSKYVADSVVEQLGARVPAGKKLAPSSPLKGYYWQRVRLSGAYWADVDARGIDFFGANFDTASLRRGRLEKAILREASFKNAVLADADVRGADLRDADFSGCDLSGIKLEGAKYSPGTLFPHGFVPTAHAMTFVEPPRAPVAA